MTTTIRVRVNPADNSEYAVYADPEDSAQPWVRSGGAVTGWEYGEYVADWPEFELAIPGTADPDPERSGSSETPRTGVNVVTSVAVRAQRRPRRGRGDR